jgi:hypothetical protein
MYCRHLSFAGLQDCFFYHEIHETHEIFVELNLYFLVSFVFFVVKLFLSSEKAKLLLGFNEKCLFTGFLSSPRFY